MARIVTVTSPPDSTRVGEMDRLALGPPGGAVTVTLEAPLTVWSLRSILSRSVPENVYESALPEAVTLYVKEVSVRSMNLTVCSPVVWRTWLSSRLLET